MNAFFKGMSFPLESFKIFMKHPKLAFYPIIPILLTFTMLVVGVVFAINGGYDWVQEFLNDFLGTSTDETWWAVSLMALSYILLL